LSTLHVENWILLYDKRAVTYIGDAREAKSSLGEDCMQIDVKRTTRVLSLAIALTQLAAGCAKEGAAKEQETVATAASDKDFPEVLATIGDQKITMSDLRARAGETLDRIDTQARLIKSSLIEATLDSILDERVVQEEARKQGKTVDDLILAEAGIGINPTDADIAEWYKANPERTGGRPMQAIAPQIADFLRNERKKAAAEHLTSRLNKERGVSVNFRPYRLPFKNEGAPTLGKAGAPIQLVEFSDFQCPFCNRFYPNLKRVEQKYGDKVQIVYRQYPIPSLHANAFKAAEASLCAHEQGKFWELHDLMFNEQSRLTVPELKEKAVRLGMDKKKFDQCMDTGRFTEQVQKDMAEGNRIGINGTPAVFINGVELKGGAVPFETVVAAIDKELEPQGSK
jgi:predicted DsbA family dithiol-disulfide isomerase